MPNAYAFAFLILACLFYSSSSQAHHIGSDENFSVNLGELEDTVKQYGPESALNEIEKDYISGDISSDKCHNAAHLIGKISAGTYGLSVAAARGNHICRSGYFHGVFESLGYNGIYDKNSIASLCSGKELQKEGDRLQCLHGLGHGLEVAHDYNTEAAVESCILFSGEYAEACAGGIYMEAMKPGHQNQVPADSNFENVNEFCGKKFANVCSRYSGYSLLRRSGNDLEKAFRDCDTSAEKQECQYGFGAIITRTLDFDPKNVYKTCANDGLNENCFLGAASEYGNSREIGKGFEFCMLELNLNGINCAATIALRVSKYI